MDKREADRLARMDVLRAQIEGLKANRDDAMYRLRVATAELKALERENVRG